MQLKPDHAKLSAYFNVDNGTGKIRGIYLQDNEGVRPIFQKWMEPFRAEGMTTLSGRGTGGTDHLSFDEVGLPGFQFIQDPIEYETRTHHTNMDVYERVQAADLKQDGGDCCFVRVHDGECGPASPEKTAARNGSLIAPRAEEKSFNTEDIEKSGGTQRKKLRQDRPSPR